MLGCSVIVEGTGTLVDVALVPDVEGTVVVDSVVVGTGAVEATAPDVGVVRPTVVCVELPARVVVVAWLGALLVTVVVAAPAVVVDRRAVVVVVAPGPEAVVEDSLPCRTITVITPTARRMRTMANMPFRGPRRTRPAA